MAESSNQDKNNTRVSVLSSHISELFSLWAWEMNYLLELSSLKHQNEALDKNGSLLKSAFTSIISICQCHVPVKSQSAFRCNKGQGVDHSPPHQGQQVPFQDHLKSWKICQRLCVPLVFGKWWLWTSYIRTDSIVTSDKKNFIEVWACL